MISDARFFYRLLPECRAHALAVVAASVVGACAEIGAIASLSPLLYSTVSASTGVDPATSSNLVYRLQNQLELDLKTSVVLFCVLALLAAGSRFTTAFFFSRTHAVVEASIIRNMTSALFRAKWSFLRTKKEGYFQKLALEDAMHAAHAMDYLLSAIASALFLTIGLAGAMLISYKLLLALGALGVANFAVFRYSSRLTARRAGEIAKSRTFFAEYLGEAFKTLKSLIGSGGYRNATAELDNELGRFSRVLGSYLFPSQASKLLMETTIVVPIAVGLYYAVQYSPTTIADLMMVSAAALRFGPRALEITYQLDKIHQYRRILEDWDAFYRETRAEARTTDGVVKRAFDQDIRFERVGFRYPDDSTRDVLKDVDFTIRKGQWIVLAGESGSGKSTLVDLLTGLLNPTSGAILVDGTPLSSLNQDAWRDLIGLVLQDTLIAKKVRESGDAMVVGPKTAQLGDASWLDFLKQSEAEAALMSGGQRQRLHLANALSSDRAIFVFDEPTAALDRKTAAEIVDQLRRLSPKHTCIIVSHDPLVLARADEVIELEAGQIKGRTVRPASGAFAGSGDGKS